MVFANLRREEQVGLGIALALHVALAAAFMLQPAKRSIVPPEEKMTVTLASDVSLKATAPDPVPESHAAIAPTLAPEPAPPSEPEQAPPQVIQPAPQPAPPPPRPVATTAPRPKPVPRPAAVRPVPSTPKPAPAKPAKPATAKAAPARPALARPKPAGGSRIGADFLPGAGDSKTSQDTRVPASQIGASAKASLFQAIAKALRPKWQPPSGPEVEDLVTKVRFRLNPDGSLAGKPEVVRQSGITDLNRPQAGRHAEQAVRAVQLAAPFKLPDEYYDAWKVVTVDFDWKLSQ